jgi:hypothetical protein
MGAFPLVKERAMEKEIRKTGLSEAAVRFLRAFLRVRSVRPSIKVVVSERIKWSSGFIQRAPPCPDFTASTTPARSKHAKHLIPLGPAGLIDSLID